MNKLKDYWRRWCLCYRENGLKYTVKKTIERIKLRLRKNGDQNKSDSKSDNSCSQNNSKNFFLNASNLNIGFKIEGGIGDCLIAANYIYKFKQKYHIPAMSIDVFFIRNPEGMKGIFGEGLVNRLLLLKDYLPEGELYRKYDLFITLSRYPTCCNRNPSKIQMFQPELLTYMQAIERFRWKYSRVFDNNPLLDGQAAMISNIYNIKRIQQGDINGLLDITEKYEFPIEVRDNAEQYLGGIGLAIDKYIVIVASADVRCGGVVNNKLWPEEYWNLLIDKIKVKYPEYKIVLIGDSSVHKSTIKADLNLSGHTRFEDVKILVRDALLLISSEGGMVHLRHALTPKKSMVLFGPTDMDFYGYSNNINLRSTACKCACEWFCKDWFRHCVNRELKACMWALTPKIVMKEIDKFFEETNNNE